MAPGRRDLSVGKTPGLHLSFDAFHGAVPGLNSILGAQDAFFASGRPNSDPEHYDHSPRISAAAVRPQRGVRVESAA